MAKVTNHGYQIRLGSGVPLEQDGHTVRGRLGLVVIDATGRVIGLTARHVLLSETRPVLYGGTPAIVGRPLATDIRPEQPRPMIESIALVELDSAIQLDETYSALNFAEPVAMRHLMGRRVRKFGSKAKATVTGLFGTIELVSSYGQPIQYYDTIEIRPDKQQQFVSSGDAGSLIVADGPAPIPVGLLMAGEGRRLFLAPVRELLDSMHLKLLTATAAIDRNLKALHGEFRAEPTVAQVRAELMAVRLIVWGPIPVAGRPPLLRRLSSV